MLDLTTKGKVKELCCGCDESGQQRGILGEQQWISRVRDFSTFGLD
jgi:hypothetical protein